MIFPPKIHGKYKNYIYLLNSIWSYIILDFYIYIAYYITFGTYIYDRKVDFVKKKLGFVCLNIAENGKIYVLSL